VVGCVLLGLVVGEVFYVALVGSPPVPTPQPWWFSVLLVGAVAVWGFRQTSLTLRAAVGLFALSQAVPHVPESAPPTLVWGVYAAVQLGFGLLLCAAYWSVTRTQVKALALTLLVLAAPARYWTIYNWHSVVDDPRERHGVERAVPSEKPLLPTSGTSWPRC
jgi:hypothetical protein